MDVIWNLTRVCPWDCEICCVAAPHACNSTKRFIQKIQKEKGEELTLAEKMEVLKILSDKGFEIDFSGGDPLYYDEDFQVVEQATRWMSSRKISVSMIGSKITEAKLELLKKVGEVEFTLDNLPETENPFRPRGYNLASMMAIKKCAAIGVKTKAVTVLYSVTISKKNLEGIYYWLCENNIPEWELLRFYPAGRAAKLTKLVPKNSEYLEAMKFIKKFHGPTKIHFQHPLRMMEGKTRCIAAIEQIGILPDGQVTACAWAIDGNCQPLKGFRLGKLPDDDLDKIIDKARKISEYSERVEFCRVMAYIEKQNETEVE